MKRPPDHIVIDCDPGLDDALALAVLAHFQRIGVVKVHGVIAVAGNVGLLHTSANARYVVERFALGCVVVDGAPKPLGERPARDAAEVHGSDGLGGLGPTPTPAGAGGADPFDPEPLHRVISSMPRGDGNRVLLAVGPLTDVAMLCRLDPHLNRLVDRVVVMGGGFGSPRGNVTPEAEFNVWADPLAWHEVAASGLPLEVVPLDVTTRVLLDRNDLAALPPGSLVARIVGAGIDLGERRGRGAVFEMHDPLAAAAVVDPNVVEWRSGALQVTLDGPSSGRTDLAGRGQHRVASEVDATAARALLFAALADTAAREMTGEVDP